MFQEIYETNAFFISFILIWLYNNSAKQSNLRQL